MKVLKNQLHEEILKTVIHFRLHFSQRHRHLLNNYGISQTRGSLLYFFYYMDIIGLITLSYVQSNEYFPIHKFGFALFLTASGKGIRHFYSILVNKEYKEMSDKLL